MNSMNRLLCTFILFHFLAFTNAYAHSALKCESLASFVNSQKNVSVKSSDISKQIQEIDYGILKSEFLSIFKNASMSLNEKLERSFSFYVERRIAMLPEPLQSAIREKAFDVKVERPSGNRFVRIFGGNFGGNFSINKKVINIKLPQNYDQSLMDFVIRAHELEHFIQSIQWPELMRKHQSLNKTQFTEVLFEVEKAAMFAEATYLMALPRGFVINSLEKVEAEFPDEVPSNFLHGVRRAATPSDYVRLQWRISRYSQENVHAIYNVQIYKFIARFGIGLPLLGYFLSNFCQSLYP
jgi:hypothetical protein